MSLFKILRGSSSRIGLSATPFHDGYAYFTPDDGGFYIDAEDDSGNQRRIRINEPNSGASSEAIIVTLSRSGWTDDQQTVSVPGVTVDSIVVVCGGKGSELEYRECGVYCSEQGEGILTFTAGWIPDIDLVANVLILHNTKE